MRAFICVDCSTFITERLFFVIVTRSALATEIMDPLIKTLRTKNDERRRLLLSLRVETYAPGLYPRVERALSLGRVLLNKFL
jgi:hypothetical protein